MRCRSVSGAAKLFAIAVLPEQHRITAIPAREIERGLPFADWVASRRGLPQRGTLIISIRSERIFQSHDRRLSLDTSPAGR